MIKEKEKLKMFLIKYKNILSDNPFFYTEKFCNENKIKFKEILNDAIEWQHKFNMEIRDEKDFIFTIL